MKNKLTVMIVTFVILIGITPLIFGKLMNSRFNTMILNLQQNKGVLIKEVKNKSSYLTTDRIFEVTIPGSVLNQKEIKYIKLLTDVTFKNLPVTNVKFLSTVKKVVLINNNSVPLIDNKIKVLVMTPDFKVYKYRVFDNSINLKDGKTVVNWKKFGGIYDKENKTFKNENGLIEFKNLFNKLKIYNIRTFLQNLNNKKVQQMHFDVNFSNKKLNINIANFNVNSKLNILNNNIKLSSTAKCDEINANNILKISKINSDFQINDIDKKLYKKIQNKNYTQKDINELLKKGFNGKFNLNIKDIFFMKDLGFLKLNSNFSIKNGSIEKINNNDLSFLDLNMSLKTSPELINIVSNFFKPIKQIVVIRNNEAIVNVIINKGNININGKQIKSN